MLLFPLKLKICWILQAAQDTHEYPTQLPGDSYHVNKVALQVVTARGGRKRQLFTPAVAIWQHFEGLRAKFLIFF
jgi:hypothetical protein